MNHASEVLVLMPFIRRYFGKVWQGETAGEWVFNYYNDERGGQWDTHFGAHDGFYYAFTKERKSDGKKDRVTTASLDLLAKWLILRHGNSVRKELEFREIVLPFKEGSIAKGWRVIEVSEGCLALQNEDGSVLPFLVWSRTNRASLFEISHIVGISAMDVLNAFEDYLGRPHLTGFLNWSQQRWTTVEKIRPFKVPLSEALPEVLGEDERKCLIADVLAWAGQAGFDVRCCDDSVSWAWVVDLDEEIGTCLWSQNDRYHVGEIEDERPECGFRSQLITGNRDLALRWWIVLVGNLVREGCGLPPIELVHDRLPQGWRIEDVGANRGRLIDPKKQAVDMVLRGLWKYAFDERWGTCQEFADVMFDHPRELLARYQSA